MSIEAIDLNIGTSIEPPEGALVEDIDGYEVSAPFKVVNAKLDLLLSAAGIVYAEGEKADEEND